jgi:hypothetical protein
MKKQGSMSTACVSILTFHLLMQALMDIKQLPYQYVKEWHHVISVLIDKQTSHSLLALFGKSQKNWFIALFGQKHYLKGYLGLKNNLITMLLRTSFKNSMNQSLSQTYFTLQKFSSIKYSRLNHSNWYLIWKQDYKFKKLK